MPQTIARLRGWPAAIAVALLALGCFASSTVHLFRHAPSYDELLHVIAARGVNATGEPVIQQGIYDRAELYTRLVARVMRYGGDELVAARIPAWISAAALIVAVALWTARLGGPLAGLGAGVLLAFSRQTIEISVFARFYTLHALVVFLAFVCFYAACARRCAVAVRGILVFGGFFALAVGWHLQALTAICAVAVIGGVLAGVVIEYRVQTFPLIRRYAAALVALFVLSCVAAYFVLTHYDLLRLFNESALWAAHAENRRNFYNQMIGEDLPLFWPLVPFAFAALALRNGRLAWSLAVTILLAIAFQSTAAQKATRYIYYCLPFICALLGLALPIALEALRAMFTRQWPQHPSVARTLPFVLFGVSILASTELYRYARVAIAHDRPRTALSYGGETSWQSAGSPLAPYLSQKPFLITSNAMKAIYYFGWYDAEMNASIVRETETQSELGEDERTGRRAFSTPASLEHVLAEAGDKPVLIVAETDKLGLDRGVPAATVNAIQKQCTTIAVPAETGLSAWTCPRSAEARTEPPHAS